MIDGGKQNLLGVLIDAVDYEGATARILAAARAGEPLAATALAVHGVIEAVDDPTLRHRVNRLDLVTPDGQPVRWALDHLHGTGLPDRCYGPTLMLHLCAAAAAEGLPVHLYGSTADVVDDLARNLTEQFPGLVVAGSSPSTFGQVSPAELDAIAERIRATGARLVFAGLGCPRQEVFAYEMRDRLGVPVLAVGAAFDYHAGRRREPPAFVQRAGLQWLWRLVRDPRRLARRYLTTNPRFVAGVLRQRAGRWRPDPTDTRPPTVEAGYA